MRPSTAQDEWEKYRETEIQKLGPLLLALGYTLDPEQPHTKGERYLMQAVTTESGQKLVLLGTRTKDNLRAVIKVSSDKKGMQELQHERVCREVLKDIRFAYNIFHTPDELFFGKKNGYLISIQVFIPQERPFLERPLTEQFSLALAAFKAQEGAHATTYGHERIVGKTFGTMRIEDYIRQFEQFKINISRSKPGLVSEELLTHAERFLKENRLIIEQYSGFLTHTDFVPHNIRIQDSTIYLLDYSSLRFGNKYEGWARFLNFMVLHNPPLAEALNEYIRLNRTPEEVLALKLMRVYRLGEIIWYYTNTLDKCTGDLCALNTERVQFWTTTLEHVLADKPMPSEIIEQYQNKRDNLRSEDEKKRQQGLH